MYPYTFSLYWIIGHRPNLLNSVILTAQCRSLYYIYKVINNVLNNERNCRNDTMQKERSTRYKDEYTKIKNPYVSRNLKKTISHYKLI